MMINATVIAAHVYQIAQRDLRLPLEDLLLAFGCADAI
jgi:hypothetical protein